MSSGENFNTNLSDEEEDGLSKTVTLKLTGPDEVTSKRRPIRDCSSVVLSLIPIAIPVLFIGIAAVTYWQAVYYHHVEPILPYIADAGTTPPEAAYLTQGINVVAVLLILLVLIRYDQIYTVYSDPEIMQQLDDDQPRSISMINKVSLIFGLFNIIGLFIAGNNRTTENFLLHCIGVGIYLIGLLFYVLTQVWISFLTVPEVTSRLMAKIRLGIAVLVVIAEVLTIAFGFWSYQEAKDPYLFESILRLRWLPEDGGYNQHVVSAVSEWLVVVFSSLFLATFATDFCKCRLVDRRIRFNMD